MPYSLDIASDSDTLLGRVNSSDEQSLGEKDPSHRFPLKSGRRCSLNTTAFIFHLFLAALYTALFFTYWDYRDCGTFNSHKNGLYAYSPAWEALKWESRELKNDLEISNPYKGLPRPELEDAWNKLLGPSSIRISEDTLKKINRTSVPLADGSGYMGGLDVYHQLHCLRYVKRYLHKEHYNMTREENLGQHIDHCIDSLRQYLMCNADLAILTFDWIPNFHRPWPNFRIVHECANWEAIEEWAWANYFDGFDESLIKHPNFHPELPGPFDYTASGNDI